MNKIEDALTAAQVEVRHAERDLAEAILRRDVMIAQAVADGVTPYRVAKWLGLTRPAIDKAISRLNRG